MKAVSGFGSLVRFSQPIRNEAVRWMSTGSGGKRRTDEDYKSENGEQDDFFKRSYYKADFVTRLFGITSSVMTVAVGWHVLQRYRAGTPLIFGTQVNNNYYYGDKEALIEALVEDEEFMDALAKRVERKRFD